MICLELLLDTNQEKDLNSDRINRNTLHLSLNKVKWLVIHSVVKIVVNVYCGQP